MCNLVLLSVDCTNQSLHVRITTTIQAVKMNSSLKSGSIGSKLKAVELHLEDVFDPGDMYVS
jgi:hypothetical protein